MTTNKPEVFSWEESDPETGGDVQVVRLSDYEALHAECEKLRKDAERYRWLCDGNGYFLEHEMLCGFENEKVEADAAIDAAMAHYRKG